MIGLKHIPIPTPEFMNLYTGIDEFSKEKIIRLSDSFMDFTVRIQSQRDV
jgi:hypothetical protein